MVGRCLARLILVGWGALAPLAAQDAYEPSLVREIDQQVVSYRGELLQAGDFEREGILESLREVEALLREQVASNPARGDLQLALYKALAAKAEFDLEPGLEVRLASFDEAIDAARKSGLTEPHARARLLKAELLLLHGRFEEARTSLRELFEELPSIEVTRAFAEFALAETEARLGSYTQALASLERAREALLPGAAWERLAGRIEGARGQIYLDLGRPDLASRAFALEEEAVGPLRAEAEIYWKDLVGADLHGSHLLLAQGRYEAAAERTHALDELLSGPAAAWRGMVLGVRAEALGRLAEAGRGDTGEARALFEEALASNVPEGDRFLVEIRLARLLTGDGRLQKSRELLSTARARMEAWARPGSGVNPDEALLATEEARLALAEGGTTEVLSERLTALRRAFDERLVLWRATPLVSGGLGFLHHPARRAWLCALTRLILAVEGEEAGGEAVLALWMRAQAQGVLVREKTLAVGEPRDVQRLLCSAEEGVLVYLPGPDRSFGLVVAAERIDVIELERSHHLSTLRDRALQGQEGAWEQLSRALLPPVASEQLQEWRSLHVVGFELLGRVPFERLVTESGRPLGLGWALAYLPSLSLGLELAKPRPTPLSDPEARGLVLFAAPEVSETVSERFGPLEALDLSEEELSQLTTSFSNVRIFAGSEASAATLEENADAAKVLQLLCHSVQLPELDRPAHLVLSPGEGDGLLSCEAVETYRAPELVLLTACRSGLGPLRRGDAAMGHMGGAWLAAGARAVLLSRDDLYLEPTLFLSRRFHSALTRGLPPAEALRRARIAFVEARGEEAFGAIAGLHLLGLGNRPLWPAAGEELLSGERREGRPGLLAWAAALLLLALLAGLGSRSLTRSAT